MEQALFGLRHKLQGVTTNPIEVERYRRQQLMLEKELSRVRSVLAHNSKVCVILSKFFLVFIHYTQIITFFKDLKISIFEDMIILGTTPYALYECPVKTGLVA